MIYTLKNDNYILKVDSFGAELKSAKYNNDEYLHVGDEVYWKRSSPVLFPIVGKLKDDMYKYNSKTYTLPPHGFGRLKEFNLEFKSDKKLIFILKESEETLKEYPFKFRFEITYILHESNFELIYNVSSPEDIFFSLGAHPAFKLHSVIDDSFIEFEKKELADLYCLDLNNGCIKGKKEFFLKSNILKLHKDIFKEDALIFKKLNSNYVTLKNNKNEKKVNVRYENFKNLGFWAPLGADFVCIEPWCGIADNMNTNHELKDKDSIEFLKKEDEFTSSLEISFS